MMQGAPGTEVTVSRHDDELLAEIARLLEARGLTPGDLIDALEQLPARGSAGAPPRPKAHAADIEHQAELEAMAVDHGLAGVRLDDNGALLVLPGVTERPAGDVLGDYATAAAAILGHRPSVRYGSWEPDGLREQVPGDAPNAQLDARFHLGSHDESITCRGCRARFDLDRDAGDWVGRHYRLCPTSAGR